MWQECFASPQVIQPILTKKRINYLRIILENGYYEELYKNSIDGHHCLDDGSLHKGNIVY